MSGWQVAHASELDAIPVGEGVVWRPVRRHFDIRAFGTNAYTSEGVGRLIIEAHDELGSGAGGHEELYVVVSGRATFTIDGETVDAPAGTMVFLRDPALRRSAVSEEEGTLVLAVGAEPGKAYDVSPWEFNFGAIPLMRAGEWHAAIELLARGLAEHPDNPSILYNLACAESQSGHAGPAISHLTRSLELSERYREHMKTDPDLDPIRHEPGFPA